MFSFFFMRGGLEILEMGLLSELLNKLFVRPFIDHFMLLFGHLYFLVLGMFISLHDFDVFSLSRSVLGDIVTDPMVCPKTNHGVCDVGLCGYT